MKKVISVVALLLVIAICSSLTVMASDADIIVQLAKDQHSASSKTLAWTEAKVVAYNSDSSAHCVNATLYCSLGEYYFTVKNGELDPGTYWHYTSEVNKGWGLFRLDLKVKDAVSGCVALAHLQQAEFEEEWE